MESPRPEKGKHVRQPQLPNSNCNGGKRGRQWEGIVASKHSSVQKHGRTLEYKNNSLHQDTLRLSVSGFVPYPIALRLSVPTHVDFSHKATSAPIIAPAITIPISAHTNVLVPCVGAVDLVESLVGPQVIMTSSIPGARPPPI